MNKGRNILLLMACLLCISLLTFFTVFQGSNKSGVVDNVRYVLNSNDDGVKSYSFYFVEGDPATATVTEDSEHRYIIIADYEYNYTIVKGSEEATAYKDGQKVSDEEGFTLYTKAFFKAMFAGKEKILQIWQAVLVAIVVFSGGAVILFAEELWHVVYKKGEEEIPAWSDMNGIKYVGGGIIALGVILLIIFIAL